MLVSLDVNPKLSGRHIQVGGLRSELQLPNRLILGNQTCMVQTVLTQQKADEEGVHVWISKSLAEAFVLPADCSLYVKAIENVWRLGPVLGLYADSIASSARPYGEQTRMFEELTTYGSELGVYVVVLSPSDPFQARFSERMQTWQKCDVEPEIVIRRSGGFSNQASKHARDDLLRYQRFGKLHTLPRSMSNKWNLYKVLQIRQTLKQHLPRTTLCTSGLQLYNELLTRHDIYLKPPGGAQGVSIYHLKRSGPCASAEWEKRIVPRKTERLTNTFETATQTKTTLLKSVNEFQAFWKSIRLPRAILQDTVILPIHNDLRVDFRWLVHASDNPKVVARVARLGQKHSITTNIHTGGTATSAETILKQMMGDKKSEELLQCMDDVALDVVRTLASQFGPFAELGIDMAVTEAGKIYIFEVNPTPGRRMLRQLSPGVRRLSLDSLLEYAVKATDYGK